MVYEFRRPGFDNGTDQMTGYVAAVIVMVNALRPAALPGVPMGNTVVYVGRGGESRLETAEQEGQQQHSAKTSGNTPGHGLGIIRGAIPA